MNEDTRELPPIAMSSFSAIKRFTTAMSPSRAAASTRCERMVRFGGALAAPLWLVAAHGDARGFAACVRAALATGGGCGAARAAVVGACVAARHGAGAVPAAWLERAHHGPGALRLAAGVVAQGPGGARVALAAMARAVEAKSRAKL